MGQTRARKLMHLKDLFLCLLIVTAVTDHVLPFLRHFQMENNLLEETAFARTSFFNTLTSNSHSVSVQLFSGTFLSPSLRICGIVRVLLYKVERIIPFCCVFSGLALKVPQFHIFRSLVFISDTNRATSHD